MKHGAVEDRHDEGSITARQIMDLRKAEMGEDRSQSEERSRDCPISPNIFESMEYNKSPMISCSSITGVVPVIDHLKKSADGGIRDHESPEEAFQGWVPNKIPKFDTSRDVDDEGKAEPLSIIRKARVSVRSRSESSTVSFGYSHAHIYIFFFWYNHSYIYSYGMIHLEIKVLLVNSKSIRVSNNLCQIY